MASEIWCQVCGKAVDSTVTRAASLAAAPVAGAIAAAIPKLLNRRLGLGGRLLQGALGLAAGYVAQRFLVPALKSQICGGCGKSPFAAAN